MSLKDRLNVNVTQNLTQENEQEPQYYVSSEIANNTNSLGVIDTLFADDDLNSIFVNGAKNIYIEKNGKSYKSTSAFKDEEQLRNILNKYIQNDEQKNISYFKFNHQQGINIRAILPPLSEKTTLNIKVYKDKHANIQSMQEYQSISREIALVLETFATIKCNILIAGERNTLKTSLLSAISKKIPSNYRGLMIDFSNELKNTDSNFSNFDFSKINNNEEIVDIFKTITLSSPEKIFINDIDENLISQIAKSSKENFKGIVTTINAKDTFEAMEKITLTIMEKNPTISYEMAKIMAYNTFDIIIFVKRDSNGLRRVSSISQLKINPNKECLIQDIFNSNFSTQIQSTGFVPDFYEIAKLNSLSINSSIFDENYKHTYYQNTDENISNMLTKRNLNIDILKKFKKDLPAREDIEIDTDENKEEEKQEENINVLYNNENNNDAESNEYKQNFEELNQNQNENNSI